MWPFGDNAKLKVIFDDLFNTSLYNNNFIIFISDLYDARKFQIIIIVKNK